MINAKGKKIQRFTTDRDSYGAEFSPSGRLIIYTKTGVGGPNPDIFISGVYPGRHRNLTRTRDAQEFDSSFGPNGQIAFLSLSDPDCAEGTGPSTGSPRCIRVIRSNGSGRRTVITEGAVDPQYGPIGEFGDVAFTPSGKILFRAANAGSATGGDTAIAGIWSINPDGSGLSALSVAEVAEENSDNLRGLTVSPKGTIGFTGVAPPFIPSEFSPSDIFFLQGGALTNFTKTPNAEEFGPAFSPLGERIALGRASGEGTELWIKNIFNLKERQLTELPRLCPGAANQPIKCKGASDTPEDWAVVRQLTPLDAAIKRCKQKPTRRAERKCIKKAEEQAQL